MRHLWLGYRTLGNAHSAASYSGPSRHCHHLGTKPLCQVLDSRIPSNARHEKTLDTAGALDANYLRYVRCISNHYWHTHGVRPNLSGPWLI